LESDKSGAGSQTRVLSTVSRAVLAGFWLVSRTTEQLNCAKTRGEINDSENFSELDCGNAKGTISVNDSKKPWYQLKDSETKWYHHLMHGRVLIMLVLMAIIGLLALGVGIMALFGE
jgi:hypothetical protein